MHYYYDGARNPKSWVKIGNLYQATDDIYVRLRDSNDLHYTWHLYPGFLTDGGSVPLAFQWVVPKWSDDNDLINLSFALHDAAYGSGLMHRSLADDMLRGMLRDAGLSRWRASAVCWAVNNFAAKHYGPENDKYDCKLFATLDVYKLN